MERIHLMVSFAVNADKCQVQGANLPAFRPSLSSCGVTSGRVCRVVPSIPICTASWPVRPHVQGSVVLASEPLGAQRALERLLPCVGALVLNHGGAQREGHRAEAALERLLARVSPQMVNEVALPAKLALAEVALIHPAPLTGHTVPAHRRLPSSPVVWKLIR